MLHRKRHSMTATGVPLGSTGNVNISRFFTKGFLLTLFDSKAQIVRVAYEIRSANPVVISMASSSLTLIDSPQLRRQIVTEKMLAAIEQNVFCIDSGA